MIAATGVRIGWLDLPAHVRAEVEAMVGGPVVSATSQPGGFSPGTADRVVTATGTRAFVKAVGTALNPTSVQMHRREARITAALPATAPVPDVIGVYDDGDWIALVLSDVEGRHPRTPWEPAELTSVLSALRDLAAALTPSPVSGLPTAVGSLGDDFAGWHRIAADPPADLEPWVAAHLPDLRAAADRAVAALDGDTLAQCDLRADNLLLRPDGSVVVVDWPHACTGPAWLDTVLLAVNVLLYGGDPAPVLAGLDPGTCTDVLAGCAGYFVDYGRRPPVPGLPTVRAFQRAQGDAVLRWLRPRLTSHG